MTITRQDNYPCPKCGSWYRNGENCNKCGKNCPPKEEIIRASTGAIRTGRQWSKKFHRYLTDKEVKAGLKGG